MRKLLSCLLLLAGTAAAEGTLTPDIRIASAALGYDLQYRVHLPVNAGSLQDLPVLFVTDGPGYIEEGRMPRVLDQLIEKRRIVPVVTVFVDARDPDNPRINRRNQQFFCNPDYLTFFEDELIPAIESDYPVARERTARTILGVSFGGLNAACFGLIGHETFSGIAMHSPANHPVPGLVPGYEKSPRRPLKFFLSTGDTNDNLRANRKFRNVLRDKGYPVKYKEVPEGHNWKNWRPLVDDVLLYFYATAD